MGDIMHIGLTALAAYQTALKVAGNNIANADTPFYSRRKVTFEQSATGSGVNVADVCRIYSETANRYVQACNSDYAKCKLYAQQFGNFEQLFDDSNINVGKFINDSLSAIQQVSNNFTASDRSLVLSRLSSVCNQFQSLSNNIENQLLNINQSLQTEVSEINNILSGIGNINNIITSSSLDPNASILDEREQLVQKLSKYFDFNVETNQNGTIDITLKNGMGLLLKNPPYNFVTTTDPANSTNVTLAISNGTNTISINDLIQGGEIAGLINFRTNGLEAAQIALGRLALVFSQTLNQQNQLGIDANGNLGVEMFTDINTASNMTNRVIANSENSGSADMTVHIDDVNQLYANNYQLEIGAGNSYTLTRVDAAGNTVVSTGTISIPQTISVDGFTLTIDSGTFSAGDQYTISPTQGAADNIAMAIQDPSALAFGWPVVASVGTKQNENSDGTIEVTSIDDTTNSAFSIPKQLNPPIQVQFSVSGGVTTYSLFDLNANTFIEQNIPYTSGADLFPTPGSYNPGYQIVIKGNNIQNGDAFNIQYNSNPATDNRNAQAMANLYKSGTVLGANGLMVSFSQGYDLLSSDISVKTNDAQSELSTSEVVNRKANEVRDTISAVSLQDEMLNLDKYQVAYQASAQVLQIAKSVFDIISSIGR